PPPLVPPLVPYTTLFRSSAIKSSVHVSSAPHTARPRLSRPAGLCQRPAVAGRLQLIDRFTGTGTPPRPRLAQRAAWPDRPAVRRSEEHTPELQSREKLVC